MVSCGPSYRDVVERCRYIKLSAARVSFNPSKELRDSLDPSPSTIVGVKHLPVFLGGTSKSHLIEQLRLISGLKV